jgi:YHS domain-containing protein
MRSAFVVCAVVVLSLGGCRGCGEAAPVGPAAKTAPGARVLDKSALPDMRVTCPVCGLEFNAKEAAATRVHDGKAYYFLLEDHARAFAADPEAYLKPAPEARDAGAAGDPAPLPSPQ